MPSSYQVVYLSFFHILVGGALLLLVICGLYFKKQRLNNADSDLVMTKDWSVPVIDCYADGDSLFHTWDPRLKIVSLVIYCFFVSAIHTIYAALVALSISLLALVASRLPWERTLRRLKSMSGFLGMFLVLLPFTVRGSAGETLIIFGGLERFPFHVSGFWTAAVIVLKATSIALLMDPVFSTAPFPVTLQALSTLGIPLVICQMVVLSHRYVHLFLAEIKRMYRAMQVRGFHNQPTLQSIQALGNFLGMVIVRSFDRTQRVYEAMMSRGYSGSFPTFVTFRSTPSDWHKTIFWLGLGGVLLSLDLYL